MNTFESQLKRGHRAEEWSLCTLNKYFSNLEYTEPGDIDGDLIDEYGQKIEIKYDRKSNDTGNVALELFNLNKSTGLSKSKSKYYFIICKGIEFYHNKWIGCLIKTNLLLSLTKNLKIVNGGDDNKIQMALMPVSELIEHSDKIIPVNL